MNLRYDLVAQWLEPLAKVMTEGEKKHKADDFSGKTAEEYFNSAMGHIVSYRGGLINDLDDGQPLEVKIAANFLILYTKRLNENK